MSTQSSFLAKNLLPRPPSHALNVFARFSAAAGGRVIIIISPSFRGIGLVKLTDTLSLAPTTVLDYLTDIKSIAGVSVGEGMKNRL
jgi:hypothetical protein